MSHWEIAPGVEAGANCEHAGGLTTEVATASGCEDCLREGTRWVHLRQCLECRHVGCCDDSPRRHATAHWRQSTHPVIASAEPGEDWAWCYPDQLMLVPAG